MGPLVRRAPFSCKKRGFCPSCSAKRMSETAVHLIDNVLPHTAYRQWVVTFPHALRYWMAASRRLNTRCLVALIPLLGQKGHRNWYPDKFQGNWNKIMIIFHRAGKISPRSFQCAIYPKQLINSLKPNLS